MMIKHLFKNFWLSFTRNSLQVLGLFLMLGIIITLFGGMIMSSSLSTVQLALIGNDLYDTNISFQFNYNLKIVSNHQNLSYGLNNINYINEDGDLDNNKVESPYFQLKPNGKDTYQIVLDSESNQSGKWLASNSSNSYFMEQLKENGEVILNFNTNIVPDSVFFSNDDYHKLVSYLQNPANLIPFVSSPDNPRLVTDTLIFTNAYKDFSKNQKRIYDLQTRLLNSVIIGSVADRALMSETMRLYDIFRAENFYIQSVQPYYWTTPIMVKGNYQDFLNYQVSDDYPPIIINNSYASHNKIKINDLFNIYGYQYRVIGFATNAYVNSAANESSFIYNPYLWLRGPEYTNLLTKITNDAPQLINSIIIIHAAFASTELNPGFLHAQNSWSDIANVYDNATF
ncbi:MAG: hypothetical protein SPLM_07570 [Spiroplasma phoeniceum]|uniref:hypothetical protein n=1 Tax=Spiroplasma phoeniceum TaxID=47835 RepID=UPI003294C799